jgi:uncharacterized protein (TIGR02186 family)
MALLTLCGLLLCGVFDALLPASASADLRSDRAVWMKVDPTEIRVGILYSGATIQVEGAIPAGYEAAVLCSGEEGSIELKRKGKVFGLLWMNVGEVVFDDVPSVYLLSTSRPLSDLAPSPVLEGLGVGYSALQSRVGRSPESAEPGGDFGEFLKLKESENLYSYDEGGLRLEPEPTGAMHVSSECVLPSKVPWGEYEVHLIGFKAGKGEVLQTERLHVAPVGVTAGIFDLARNHGLLYGILAVLIALGVGLLTGLAFGLRSKKGD